MYEFFVEYEKFLVGQRIKNDISSANSKKSRMFNWNDFETKYLNSLSKMKKCISDIRKLYKTDEDKLKYEILEYDIKLLQKYENYMNDLDLRLKQNNKKLTASERKEYKLKISTDYSDLISNLLIECDEDFVENKYTKENIMNSKYAISEKINRIKLNKIIVSKKVLKSLHDKDADVNKIITSFKNYLRLKKFILKLEW